MPDETLNRTLVIFFFRPLRRQEKCSRAVRFSGTRYYENGGPVLIRLTHRRVMRVTHVSCAARVPTRLVYNILVDGQK